MHHGLKLQQWNRRLERDWDRSWKSEPGSERVLILIDNSGKTLLTVAGSEWLEKRNLKPYLPSDEEIEGLLKLGESFPRLPQLPGMGPPGGFDGPPPRGPEPFGERPPPRPPEPAIHAVPRYFTVLDDHGAKWRLVALPYAEATLFTGTRLAYFTVELTRMRDYLIAIVPVGLLAIGGAGWLISRRALRPLKRISETASHVTAMGLDERIPVTGKEFSEFSQLVGVLNDMMERLEGSFRQATRFTADASHELKTPIALMQAEIETVLKKCPPGSSEQTTLLNIAEEVQRLKRITQSLLLLSQVDAGHLQLAIEKVDFSAECEALREDAEVLCESSSLSLKETIQPGISVEADKVLLMQAAQNLLRNAVRYNVEGGTVIFSLQKESGDAILEFSNTGPAIPLEEREKIFERFYRVDPSRDRSIDGFGLGLNLAQEIVRAHGGTLRLLEPKGDLTRFQIRLKAAAV